jgi:hypothetical protein
MQVEKLVTNVVLATHAILGGARRQKRGRAVREVGREARSSKTRGRKRPNTSREGFKARGKGRLWRRESVPCPRELAWQGRHSVGREWAGRGQEEAL